MRSFIEELFYGNIKPQNSNSKESKTYRKEMNTLSKNEDLLLNKLSVEDRKLFLEYVDAWGIVDGESIADSFVAGFRLGAYFAIDTFCKNEISMDAFVKEK